MARSRRIWLYGNSVIIGTLGVSLRRAPQFEVTVVVPPLPDIPEQDALKPDVVFFDLDSPYPKEAFLLLESCPGLKLIGVSPDNNIVKVWSGKQLRELSTKDLLEVINEQLTITETIT